MTENITYLPLADDLAACARSLRITVSALARLLQTKGCSAAESARSIRQHVDAILEEELGATLRCAEMLHADRVVLCALERLESEPGFPIRTTRAAIAAEANVQPTALDAALARLKREARITHAAKPGTGTVVTILRRAA